MSVTGFNSWLKLWPLMFSPAMLFSFILFCWLRLPQDTARHQVGFFLYCPRPIFSQTCLATQCLATVSNLNPVMTVLGTSERVMKPSLLKYGSSDFRRSSISTNLPGCSPLKCLLGFAVSGIVV